MAAFAAAARMHFEGAAPGGLPGQDLKHVFPIVMPSHTVQTKLLAKEMEGDRLR
jgi:hypothetical protein